MHLWWRIVRRVCTRIWCTPDLETWNPGHTFLVTTPLRNHSSVEDCTTPGCHCVHQNLAFIPCKGTTRRGLASRGRFSFSLQHFLLNKTNKLSINRTGGLVTAGILRRGPRGLLACCLLVVSNERVPAWHNTTGLFKTFNDPVGV